MHAFERARGFLRRVTEPAAPRDLAAVALVVVAGRLAAWVAGVRFDASELGSFWHFAPQHLLETRLAETVLYLHFQPPLFNLYLGCVLKLFGPLSTVAFAASFLLLGLATALALFVLMRRLGAERRIALGLTCLFALAPATLLFENFLFYELPVAALLVFSALSLDLGLERGSAPAFATFFSCVAAIVLTRALFHPLVLIAAALGPFFAFRRHRRALLRGVAVPALVVAVVCAKNWVIFDEPGTSTWLGMGLARMTLRNLDPETKAAWVREGVISPVAGVHPPSPLESYAKVMPLPAKTGIPVLDEPKKPGGDLNLHHLAYARISHALLADDVVVLRRAPSVYFDAARVAFRRFFTPASAWHPLAKNLRHIALYDRLYRLIVHFGNGPGPMGLLLPASMLWATLRARRRELPREHRVVVSFMAVTMTYVLASGTLLEPLENMRFRFAIEPYLWALVALFLTGLRSPAERVSR